MKLIIPMAGRGSRLRPHTLTVPKPLIPIAGKPIVQRLVEDIVDVVHMPVEEIAFIIGDFGKEVEESLLQIAAALGATGKIYYQDQPLGTAHAIYMAEPSLDGEVIVAFADTLFRADFELDRNADGVIWVKEVDNPQSFGVVTLNNKGAIRGFVEKPKEFVSDLAIIGIYYFKDGDWLRKELKYLLDHQITGNGEYQLTDALENMRAKGASFMPGKVNDWMDCGNKGNVLDTNERILRYLAEDKVDLNGKTAQIEDSVIIPPCFIGENVRIERSVIGPYVSVGNNSLIKNSVVKRTLVQEESTIEHAVLERSMIGNHAEVSFNPDDLDIGDYSRIKN